MGKGDGYPQIAQILLVPKLRLVTHLWAKLCFVAALSGVGVVEYRAGRGNRVAKTSLLPNRVWERGGKEEKTANQPGKTAHSSAFPRTTARYKNQAKPPYIVVIFYSNHTR